MPKSLPIEPGQVRTSGTLKFTEIPINQYKRNIKNEKTHFGEAGLLAMLHDMIVVREFETMLNTFKTMGAWEGIEYNHRGRPTSPSARKPRWWDRPQPSIPTISYSARTGATARSRQMPLRGAQDRRREAHFDHGSVARRRDLRVRETHAPRRYILPRAQLHRVRHPRRDLRAQGRLQQGMGGSMHAFFLPFGSMPNNAIVGGSADIALGSALFKRINKKPGIVIANIGDASMGCGPVWRP